MLNIDVTKARPSEGRRGEVVEWRGNDAKDRQAGDQTPARLAPPAPISDAELRLFALAVSPWLTQAARVVEIGPGAGRWTLRIAPLVRELVVVDVAEAA